MIIRCLIIAVSASSNRYDVGRTLSGQSFPINLVLESFHSLVDPVGVELPLGAESELLLAALGLHPGVAVSEPAALTLNVPVFNTFVMVSLQLTGEVQLVIVITFVFELVPKELVAATVIL